MPHHIPNLEQMSIVIGMKILSSGRDCWNGCRSLEWFGFSNFDFRLLIFMFISKFSSYILGSKNWPDSHDQEGGKEAGGGGRVLGEGG